MIYEQAIHLLNTQIPLLDDERKKIRAFALSFFTHCRSGYSAKLPLDRKEQILEEISYRFRAAKTLAIAKHSFASFLLGIQHLRVENMPINLINWQEQLEECKQ